jgi:hypothetical protein
LQAAPGATTHIQPFTIEMPKRGYCGKVLLAVERGECVPPMLYKPLEVGCQQFDGNLRYKMIYIESTTVNRGCAPG